MTSGNRADFVRTAKIIYQKYRALAKDRPHVEQAQSAYLDELRRDCLLSGRDFRPYGGAMIASNENLTADRPGFVTHLESAMTEAIQALLHKFVPDPKQRCCLGSPPARPTNAS